MHFATAGKSQGMLVAPGKDAPKTGISFADAEQKNF